MPTIIWVMCWKNVLTGETGECIGHEDIKEFFTRTSGAIYIGHNILRFDGPHINRLVGEYVSVKNCIDTLILSTLYSPSLSGGHSLNAWGERLGNAKIEFNDFSELTPEMIKYCHQDVAITCVLFKSLINTLIKIGFTEQSVFIQHHHADLIERQHLNGFKFDGKRAISLYTELRELENKLGEEIRKAFPPERVLAATRRLRTKSGDFTAIYLRDRERYIIEETGDGGYRAYEDVEFSIASPKQRVEKLKEKGWVPQTFTKKGTPKPFDKGSLSPCLERFLEDNDIPEVALIAKWMAINGRANMINTWLNEWNEEDECIHGKLFVADTLRMRHQAPNTANIPAVRVTEKKNDKGEVISKSILLREEGYYTYEARDCWIARKRRVLVGTDAAGLELRMLAHYLNRPDFTYQVVEGDPHQYNADQVGIPRSSAKTLIYAILYGAAAPKIAATLGVSVKEGAYIRNMFLERLGLKDLIEECQAEQAEGRITLVDGSKIICPSPHSALNYKLQGGGARVMSLGAILLTRIINRESLDSLKVGDIHDEWQYDVAVKDSERHAYVAVEAIKQAGVALKLNVPLDGESKIGKTWAETH